MASLPHECDAAVGAPPIRLAGEYSLSPFARWATLVLVSARPKQWVKNLFVLAPLFFTANIHDPALVQNALAAFVCFCGLSATIYLFNDILDRNRDRLHPAKSLRPIAAGELPPVIAGLAACFSLAGSLIIASVLDLAFVGFSLAYVGLMTGYCLGLKRLFLWDAGCIAAGFALRAAAGGAAIDVKVTHWLYICTILVSLFLTFGKRRWELSQLGETAVAHRPALADYNVPLLDQLVSITAGSCLVCYLLYCVLSSTASHHAALLWTAPFVGFGLCRYLHHIYCKGGGGCPEEVLWKDGGFVLNGLAYAVAVLLALYLT